MIFRNILCTLALASSASAGLRSAVTLNGRAEEEAAAVRKLEVTDTVSSEGAVTLVTGTKDVTALQIVLNQVWVGNAPDDCGDASNASTTANRVVLVYKDPDTGDIACDRYARMDACFKRTMLIGCDAKTGTADIDVYVSDGEFPPQMRIPNPNLPARCGLGSIKRLGRTLKHTSSFPCISAPDENPSPVRCLDDSSCGKGQYCGMVKGSRTGQCMPFTSTDGAFCGGETNVQCNPNSHYCYDPDACYSTDKTVQEGTCEPLGATCKGNKECNSVSEYCDVGGSGTCKRRQAEGACCSEDDECAGDTFCRDDVTDNVANKVCTKPCDLNADCPEGSWCGIREFNDKGINEANFCKSYVGVGSTCGGYRMEPDLCDPSVSFCLNSQSCMIPDLSGQCTAYGPACKTSLDCDATSEYCDTYESKCKPKLEEGTCCQRDDQCFDGFICPSKDSGIWQVCERASTSSDGPLQCTSNKDCDETTAYCTHNSDLDGLYCKLFELEGEDCNEDIVSLDYRACAPGSFCRQPNTCWGNIEYGSCTAYGDKCKRDSECGADQYCDHIRKTCKPKNSQGSCCWSSDQCDNGLVCTSASGKHGYGVKTCEPTPPSCDEDEDCSAGEYCKQSFELKMKICKAYAPIGGTCGGLVPFDLERRCDPSTSHCFNPFCTLFDAGGSCVAFGADCSAHSDCDTDTEYCDVKDTGKCTKKIVKWGCCKTHEECSGELVCQKSSPLGFHVCALPKKKVVLPGPEGPLPSLPLPSGGGPVPVKPLPGPGLPIAPVDPMPFMEEPSTTACFSDSECEDGQSCSTSFPGGPGLCAEM